MLSRDIRYGLRSLVKSPTFTLTAILILALGIGANTAIFSVVNSVLLKPLPFDRPERVVTVLQSNPGKGIRRDQVSPANFLDWQRRSRSFESLGAFERTGLGYRPRHGEAEQLDAYRVTRGFFRSLGVQPQLGRVFSAEEDRSGGPKAVVLSHGFWSRRLGRDPQVLGRSLDFSGTPYSVVGVMPARFDFPPGAEVLVPMAFEEAQAGQRGSVSLIVVGRLKSGISREAAQAEMDGISRRLQEEYPEANEGMLASVRPIHEQVFLDVRALLLVLLAAVGMVLLIGCANVANLLLARALGRQREVAVRMALGASRARLLRQLLTENVVLGVAGGLAGVLLARLGIDLLLRFAPDSILRVGDAGLDGAVLAFAGGLSVATAVLFGLLPALQASRTDVQGTLKEGGASRGGRGRVRLQSTLVVWEVALALVLLVVAGLMLRSLLYLQEAEPGFVSENVVTFGIQPTPARYATPAAEAALFDRVARRFRRLPQVKAAGGATTLPLSGAEMAFYFSIEGRPALSGKEDIAVGFDAVTADYFRALGIPLLAGRVFDARDDGDALPVAVISETLARRYWGGSEALGERIQIGPNDRWWKVVGVVGDVRHGKLGGSKGPRVYVPHHQERLGYMGFAVQAHGEPEALIPLVRKVIREIDPDQATSSIRTMEEHLADSESQQRFITWCIGIFSSLALVLAALGIYGVMTYQVRQRVHEIGVRQALGARRIDIFNLVFRRSLKLVTVGLGIGLAVSLVLGELVSGLLAGVSPRDPLTFVGIALVMLAAAVAATFVPARGAMRVDPVITLRQD